MFIKSFFKCLFLVVTLLVLPFSVVLGETLEEGLTALKEATRNEGTDGEYEIRISVPGKEKETITGYNVLFVLDASTSTDYSKWPKMREAVLSTVDVFLEHDENNVNKVGLMTFGIASHLNIPLTNDKTEFEKLPEKVGGSLLSPGRSATNNEVGFTGAYRYLSSLDELSKDREHTYVIYLSDGESNLNEKEFNYYEIGKNSYLDTQRNTLKDSLIYLDNNKEVGRVEVLDEIISKVKELYLLEGGNEGVDVGTIFSSLSENEKLNIILDEGIDSIYSLFGYTDKTKTYSAGDYETLFTAVTYIEDEEANALFENIMYYPILSHGKNRIENALRAVEAGNELKKIAKIYTIGFDLWRDDAKKIMIPDFGGSGNYTANTLESHFSEKYEAASTSTIQEILKALTIDISYTKYKNIKVVDYTSKWVSPKDINNDGIFNEEDITVYNQGSIVENKNVKVTKLTKEEIVSSNDIEVFGNASSDIYKIEWLITEEYLKSWDKYELSYEVNVDIEENGFTSGKEYKANGKTTLIHNKVEGNNGGEIVNTFETDIEVPTVSQVIKGQVIVHYVDSNGNKVSDNVTFEGIVGEKYKTEVKDIPSYYLVAVDGNQSGKFTNCTLEITYIYNILNTEEIIVLPPKTSYNTTFSKLLDFILLIFSNIYSNFTE